MGDGRCGFYTVAEVDEDSSETHSLWLFELDGAPTLRLGEELGDISAPSPSPDGLSFALVANVDGRPQVHVVPVDGGPARQITTLPQGVSGRPAWSPDGRSIAFAAAPIERRDRSMPYRIARTIYRFDGLGYLDDAVKDLFVVDVESRSFVQLTNDASMNFQPRWSPDGSSLCYLVSFAPDRPWAMLPELHVLAIQSRQSHVLVGDWGGVFNAEWCADGEHVAFVGFPVTGAPDLTEKWDLWTVEAAGGTPECRTTSLLAGIGSKVHSDVPVYEELTTPHLAMHDGVAHVSGQVGGDVVIYRVGLKGPETVERITCADDSAYLVDFEPQSGVLYQSTSFLNPPELMLEATRITTLNDQVVGGLVRPDLRKLEVTAPDGLRSEAWALTPPDENGPWPTVLYIHGGPHGAFGSTYMIDFHLLVSAGFAVVFNNFRGSRGYGTEFAQKIVGDWGPAGSLDHHASVDEAVRLGIADPERVGVCGYSHGGFATCWLVATSDRFKAGVAENPVTSFASAVGVMDTAEWIVKQLGGLPHEVPTVYRDQSPLTFAPRCRTPLLFITGDDDMRCHPIESEQYYRVLKANGVPTEMLRLPNSPHIGSWNGPVTARVAQNEALVDWFARFLT